MGPAGEIATAGHFSSSCGEGIVGCRRGHCTQLQSHHDAGRRCLRRQHVDTSVLDSLMFHKNSGYHTGILRIFDNHKKIYRMLGIFPCVNQKTVVHPKLYSENSIVIFFIGNILL